MMKTKKCSNPNCKDPIKAISEFSKSKNRKDGLHPWCKECEKNYRDNNKQKIAKQKKEYQEKLNINRGNVCAVILNKRKTAGGFIWKFK